MSSCATTSSSEAQFRLKVYSVERHAGTMFLQWYCESGIHAPGRCAKKSSTKKYLDGKANPITGCFITTKKEENQMATMTPTQVHLHLMPSQRLLHIISYKYEHEMLSSGNADLMSTIPLRCDVHHLRAYITMKYYLPTCWSTTPFYLKQLQK